MDSILKNVLITGAHGMVGSYFDFGIKLGHGELDITDTQNIREVFEKYRPSVVVHLAGATDVDRCEREPEYANLVNGIGTQNIVDAALRINARVIYVSTVFAFNGTKPEPYLEHDAPMPLNRYGASKVAGEQAVASMGDKGMIIRAAWMFGGGPTRDKKFVAKIIRLLGADPISVASDTFGSLTYARDLAAKIKECILAGVENCPRILHVVNGGFCSRHEIAVEIARLMGSDTNIIPVASTNFRADAPRSNSDRLESSYGGIMRPWQAALADYLQSEWTSDITYHP